MVFFLAGAGQRKKVQRVSYNDKGEEVTEMVFECEPPAADANGAAPAQVRTFTTLAVRHTSPSERALFLPSMTFQGSRGLF